MREVFHLYDDLENFAFNPAGREMCLYGDPPHPLRFHLHARFRFGFLTRQMQMLNEATSAAYASVEWLFGDIINDFNFLDFKENWKIGQFKSSWKNVHSLCYFKKFFNLSLFQYNSCLLWT